MSPLDPIFGLHGTVAVITGATSGIGRAIAELFARAGATLAIASHEPAECEATAAHCRALGAPAAAIPTDVRRLPDLRHLIARTEAELGPVGVLVCNAGIPGPAGPMHETTEAEWRNLLAINLEHPLHLTSLVAPLMAARSRGAIVLTSSLAGLRGNARVGAYALTKAALTQLARNLAVEWGPSGVRANAVAPGLIATDWAGAILSDPKATKRRLSMTPLRRIGTPEEVAAAALFLAAPASAFITGHTLVVDGGTLITDGN